MLKNHTNKNWNLTSQAALSHDFCVHMLVSPHAPTPPLIHVHCPFFTFFIYEWNVNTHTPCYASFSTSSSETYLKDSIVNVKLSILCHPSNRKDHLPPAVQLHSLLFLFLNLYLFIQESTTVLICLTDDDGRGASSLSLSRALIILLSLIVDMYYYCTTTTTVQNRLCTLKEITNTQTHSHKHTSLFFVSIYTIYYLFLRIVYMSINSIYYLIMFLHSLIVITSTSAPWFL